MVAKHGIVERIESANKDQVSLNRFIDDSRYFIASEIAKVVKRYVDPNADEYLTVGMMGFHESIQAYSQDKGAFYAFAGLVIRRRVIDQLHKDVKSRLDETSEINEMTLVPLSQKGYQDETLQMERIETIQHFSEELLSYDINFEKLVNVTPKSGRIKKLFQSMAKFIFNDEVQLMELKKKKSLPIKTLVEEFQTNRKKVERGRQYIIACVIVLQDQYISINSYLK